MRPTSNGPTQARLASITIATGATMAKIDVTSARVTKWTGVGVTTRYCGVTKSAMLTLAIYHCINNAT